MKPILPIIVLTLLCAGCKTVEEAKDLYEEISDHIPSDNNTEEAEWRSDATVYDMAGITYIAFETRGFKYPQNVPEERGLEYVFFDMRGDGFRRFWIYVCGHRGSGARGGRIIGRVGKNDEAFNATNLEGVHKWEWQEIDGKERITLDDSKVIWNADIVGKAKNVMFGGNQVDSRDMDEGWEYRVTEVR